MSPPFSARKCAAVNKRRLRAARVKSGARCSAFARARCAPRYDKDHANERARARTLARTRTEFARASAPNGESPSSARVYDRRCAISRFIVFNLNADVSTSQICVGGGVDCAPCSFMPLLNALAFSLTKLQFVNKDGQTSDCSMASESCFYSQLRALRLDLRSLNATRKSQRKNRLKARNCADVSAATKIVYRVGSSNRQKSTCFLMRARKIVVVVIVALSEKRAF